MTPALPSSDQVLASIRTSCARLTESSGLKINDDAIDKFLSQLNESDINGEAAAQQHGIRLPLQYDSPEAELNMLCVLSMLNFLSGYRIALKRLTTRGAWDNILFLALSAHLSGDEGGRSSILSTQGMRQATASQLAALMQITTHVEKPHPTLGPAVRVGEKDDEAIEILELVARALKETGRALERADKRNLGDWVKDKLIETRGDAGKMVHALASTFETFNDVYEIDGEPVYILKKSLFLLTVVKHTFASREPAPPFPLPDISALPMFADNVLPTMLMHFDVIDTSASTDPSLTPSALSANRSISTTSAARLRAASILAGQRITARAREMATQDSKYSWMSNMTEHALDGYLWSVGKKGAYRDIERVAERGTYMY